MDHYKKLFCSKGIREFPLFMQTAFFVWPSTDAMFDYAYSTPKHAEMIKIKGNLTGTPKNYLHVLNRVIQK